MSVDRRWHWSCDGCGHEEVRDDYGLPKGWVFVKAMEVTHRCPACAESVPNREKGYPKVVAEK